MITSIDAYKIFDNMWHSFTVKTLNKLGIKGNFLYLIKGTCKKPPANIILDSEKLNVFP